MLILIRTFLVSNIWWALLASTVASGFAGGYAVKTWYKANQLNELKQALAEREKNDKEATHAEITVNRLPDGASAQKLFDGWSRLAD